MATAERPPSGMSADPFARLRAAAAAEAPAIAAAAMAPSDPDSDSESIPPSELSFSSPVGRWGLARPAVVSLALALPLG